MSAERAAVSEAVVELVDDDEEDEDEGLWLEGVVLVGCGKN